MEENVELTLEEYFRETMSKVVEASKSVNQFHNSNNEIVRLLTTFFDDLPKKIDTSKRIVSFDNPIERILYMRSNPKVDAIILELLILMMEYMMKL